MIEGVELRCVKCGKHPDEIQEYVDFAARADMTPNEFVVKEEGTLNHKTGQFACTSCYIELGMPSSPQGWTP